MPCTWQVVPGVLHTTVLALQVVQESFTAMHRLLAFLLLLAAHLYHVQGHQSGSHRLNLRNREAATLPLFHDAGRGGIVHVRLASEKLGDNSESVMLHLFLRAIVAEHQLLIKGFGFVEGIDEIKMDMMHLTQPYCVKSWYPDISLISVDDGRQYPFSVDLTMTRDNPWRPFHLQRALPVSAADSAYRLQVDDWRRYGFYYPRAHVIKDMPSQPVTYSVVFSTFFRDQRSTVIDLMLKHMEYHAVLGISTHLVYVHSDYLNVMMEDSRVLKLIQSGSLELIYWDVFGGYDTPVWEYATQALMYNHALLTMWGESRRLAFLDIDEYIATRNQADLSSLFATCFQPGQLQVFRRFDALCSSCKAGTSELAVWQHNDVWSALLHYSLLRRDTGGISLDLGKCIADPDYVHSYFVHDAALEGNAQSALVPESCAFVVHFVSMIEPRASPEGFHHDTSWHWFKRPAVDG